jgi:DNA-binding winged helix-turn-helix (wHTH) protein/TolB-like protein/Tfp pilus assembly protein PilF
MNDELQQYIRFDEFELDTSYRVLRRNGDLLALKAKTFDLLAFLLRNKGRIVSKDEIIDEVWDGQFVEESNLTVQISALRKVLGETKDNPRFLITVPGKGYKFVGETEERNDEIIIEKHQFEQLVIDEEIGQTNSSPSKQIATGRPPLQKSILFLSGTFLLILLGVSVYRYFGPPPEPPIRSIAVLPFKPLVAEKHDESLEMGMADTLIAKLSNFRDLKVRPISAVRKYAGVDQDAIAAGREQTVDAVLDGQIQQSGEKIRVTVTLLRVDGGSVIWTNQFDEKWTDIFAVQDSISERIAELLAIKLSGEEQRQLKKRPTESTEAYQSYLLGRYHWNRRTNEGFEKAIQYFERAIQQDPAFALAYVGLADSYLIRNIGDFSQAMKAKAAAQKALEIDEALGEAHCTLATILAYSEWRFNEAERQYKLAIQLNPNYPTAHHWYAGLLVNSQRFDEGFAEYNRALELDPLSLAISSDLGTAYYYARQNDRAIEHFRKLIEMDPNFVRTYFYLSRVYAEKKMFDEALDSFERGYVLSGGDAALVARQKTVIKNALRSEGERGYWLKVIEFFQSETLKTGREQNPITMAARFARLNERDEAFRLLEKSFAERNGDLIYIKVSPEFDSIRDDPRFHTLLNKIGFPD